MLEDKRKIHRTGLVVAAVTAFILGSSFLPPLGSDGKGAIIVGKRGGERILAQASTETTIATPAVSSEPDAVSASTGEWSGPTEGKDHCLGCHGPFEKLAERTADYITEWDEKANPHVFVPHDSTTITECADCHEPHAIPYDPGKPSKKANVSYCYSCHHAETLATCSQCHNE